MKVKRKVAGGLVILGIVIATFFKGLFPGFGSGSGDGEDSGPTLVASTDSSQPPATTPLAEEQPAQPEDTPEADEPAPETKAALETLDVLIDGHDYLVSVRGKGYTVVPLPAIMNVAKETSGNEDGIRVRILRKNSARVVAWSRLFEELEEVGIANDKVLMPKDLVADDFEG